MITDDSREHRDFALPGSRLHYGPDKTVDVEHIDLDLKPDLQAKRLDGVCTTTVRALDETVTQLRLDAIDLIVDSVTRDGRAQRFDRRDDGLTITFDPPLAPGQRASFAVAYRVEHPRHGLFFIEPSDAYPEKVRHLWTQSQDQNARFWFPCLDYPHEKQTTSATITVPRGAFALSNGELVEKRDEGDCSVYRYRQDVPHSTYLVTLVAGPFVERQQRENVYYYVMPGREADGERAFGNTPKMIDVFEECLGTPYPYARYSQIAVTDFIFGGMENTSATTQTDRTLHDERAHLDFSSDPLVSHELAHQWFGDLLTCRDWSHAWLNEGFATYFEAIFREADLGHDEYLYDIFGCVERYLEEEGDRYSRPIVCNRFRDPIELFDRHLYEKGGAVLHMLRGELGEARFWRAIRRYVADNAGRSVETIDFIRAIEHATGRNMRGFFDQWVFRPGHPKLALSAAFDAERRVLSLTIDQQQHIDETHPPYAFDMDVSVEPESGERRALRVHVERAHETFALPMDAAPSAVHFDPQGFVVGDVTYKLGTALSAAALRGSVIEQIRAARELAQDGSAAAREALKKIFDAPGFWGVQAEAAMALGKTRAPWARALLVRAISHAHPKVRRAVAAALGSFRDASAADALLKPAAGDASYFVQAAALTSLGKTRDPRAFDVVRDAVAVRSWNGVIESGAAAGLGELGDARAVPLLIDAAKYGNEEALRRAALPALARLAELADSQRSAAIETIRLYFDDPMFMVQRAAVHAAERLHDPRVLGDLDRLASSAFDGRIRRDAAEAAARIRQAQRVPAQVSALQSDLDVLREEHKKLQEQIAALTRA